MMFAVTQFIPSQVKISNSSSDNSWHHFNEIMTIVNSYVYITYGICVLITTCISNSLVLWIFRKRRIHIRGYHVPLIALAVSDIISALYVIGIDRLTFYSVNYFYPPTDGRETHHPPSRSSAACKIFSYIWVVSTSISCNILLLATVERLIALRAPFWHHVHVTYSTMLYATLAFIAFIFLINVPIPIYFDVADFGFIYGCYVPPQLDPRTLWALQVYINLVVDGLGASVLLMILNGFIALQFFRIQREHLRISISVYGAQQRYHLLGLDSRSDLIKGAVTVVILGVLYIALTGPKTISYFLAFLATYGYFGSSEASVALSNLATTFDMIFYTYSSLSLVIYYRRYPYFRFT